MTAVHPSSRSIGTDTSPVYAPEVSGWTFWAPTQSDDALVRSATASSQTDGGHTPTETPSSPSPTARETSEASRTASSRLVFIFQLPTIHMVEKGW